jgi:hypothetical protein
LIKNIYKICLTLLLGSNLSAQGLGVFIQYEMVQLSYIEADRAAGVLKALGYAVVDYNAVQGVNPKEVILEPSEILIQNGSIAQPGDLPIVIVMPETENITLLEMQSEAASSGSEMSVDMGGSSLVFNTTSEPLQRLLIGYNPSDMDGLYRILDIIKNKIDQQAKQIVIDALVLEIDSERISELGINYSSSSSPLNLNLSETGVPQGTFTMVYDKSLLGQRFDFNAKLEALISSQDATILSRPSVIVMDGRQARIVVGQQIPISETSVSENFATTQVKYIQVGIVLNLRPRVSSDNRNISMQVETIISETEEGLSTSGSSVGGILSAPTINSRKVQTYVNVPDDTPFIIGGLISSKKSKKEGGVPILSKIPILGNLFKYTLKSEKAKEVIVLITPTLVDVSEDNFTKVIPKDSDRFQQFGSKLFQNSYRIQNKDVYDLDFVTNSDLYTSMVTELKFLTTEYLDAKEDKLLIPILSGHLPGEKILIRKMLWEIVRSIDYHQYVNNKKIFYFTKDGDFIGVNSFHDVYKDFLRKHQKSGKILKIVFKQDFSETTEKYIKRPTASSDIIDYPKHYKKTLFELNADKNTSTIIIGSDKYEKYLYETLVVEKIVELNPGILDNISNFKPGLQIVFPSPEIIESESFILDDKVARHLYENINYNRAFDTAFIEGIEKIQNRIDTEYK